VLEGALIYAPETLAQEVPSSAQGFGAVQMVLLYQHAAGKVLASQRTDALPVIEQRLLSLGDVTGSVERATKQPQLLGTLQPRLKPRLGQPGNPRHSPTPTAVPRVEPA
jgi:hypothetical protein